MGPPLGTLPKLTVRARSGRQLYHLIGLARRGGPRSALVAVFDGDESEGFRWAFGDRFLDLAETLCVV